MKNPGINYSVTEREKYEDLTVYQRMKSFQPWGAEMRLHYQVKHLLSKIIATDQKKRKKNY